jgi:class 3 adenylate cyclase
MLSRRLVRQGLDVAVAEDGVQALAMLRARPFDLLLLDLMMPEMNGYQVLEAVKADPALRHIPVVVISAVDEIDSVVRCIELGAEDYLPKPFNPVLLRARVGACLEKKRLRDQEQVYLREIEHERERAERLLRNILPDPIAERLKQQPTTIADSFDDVTVLFADLVDFTHLSARISPTRLVNLLNDIFTLFDQLADRHGLEKIKTIGDAYMAVAGLPTPREDHVAAAAEMALDMRRVVTRISAAGDEPITLRIGMHSGPVVAGVIGTKKFIYDLWGDTVNTASRMESQGVPGEIQVTDEIYARLCDGYVFRERGSLAIKGKGEVVAYLLNGRR